MTQRLSDDQLRHELDPILRKLELGTLECVHAIRQGGYVQKRPLTPEEKDDLPDRIFRSALGGDILWRGRHYDEEKLGKDYPDVAVHTLRQWLELCEPRNQGSWLGK